MDTKQIVNSKVFTWVIVGIAGFALLCVVFRAGMVVGFNKANFSYRWGDQYHTMFGGPSGGWVGNRGPGMMGGRFPGGRFGQDEFISPHSVVGTVLKMETSTILIKDVGNVEKSLIISPNTTIRRGPEVIKITDLKPNDRVVVIGAPSSTGEVEARFIRVFNQ